jgi:type IV secretory pathway TrbL component
MMHLVKDLVGWILVALSVYMVIKGLGLYLQTSEGVRVFEVTMLITLANQLAQIMMWLGLLAIWKVLPGPPPVKCSGGSDVKHGGASSTTEGRGDTKTEPVIE